MKIKIKLLKDALLPTRGSEGAAGYDFYVYDKEVKIVPGNLAKIRTGVFLEIPKGHYLMLAERSSLHAIGLDLSNGVGIIDSDYRGEILLPIINHTNYNIHLHRGDRIAQGVLQKFNEMVFDIVDELSDTIRDDGGFGHTGV